MKNVSPKRTRTKNHEHKDETGHECEHDRENEREHEREHKSTNVNMTPNSLSI